MLDFSMGEIGLIAAVALVVLGPDKLPQVAKTAGSLMGRAQRFVSQVKNDIDKEIELSELKKIQEDARKMASDLQSNLKNTTDQIEKQMKEVSDTVNAAGQDFKSQMDAAEKGIKDSWNESSSSAQKSELSMENIVEGAESNALPAETASTEASASSGSFPPNASSTGTDGAQAVSSGNGDWGDLDRKIDASKLESAFDWPEPYPSSAVPEELQGPAPTAASVSGETIPNATLADLMREIENLKKQVQAHASAQRGSRFAPASRLSRTSASVRAEPPRASVSRPSFRNRTKGRFAPGSHVNKPSISRFPS